MSVAGELLVHGDLATKGDMGVEGDLWVSKEAKIVGDILNPPQDHVIYFIGDQPCEMDGSIIAGNGSDTCSATNIESA